MVERLSTLLSNQVVVTGGKIERKHCMLLARRWEGPDGLEIGAGGESRVRAFEGVLSIVGALKTDAGNYTCVVENAAGVRRRPVAIVVSGQFRVTSISSSSLIPLASGVGRGAGRAYGLVCLPIVRARNFFARILVFSRRKLALLRCRAPNIYFKYAN